MFADDTTSMTHNHQDRQNTTNRFSKSVKVFGLKINLKKAEVMYQPLSESYDTSQDIQIVVLT